MRDEYNIAELNPRKNPYVEAPFTATTQENVHSLPEAQMPADNYCWTLAKVYAHNRKKGSRGADLERLCSLFIYTNIARSLAVILPI